MAHDEYGCACCQANLGMLFAYDTVDPQCAQIQILPIGRRRFIAGASAAAGLAALSACGSSAKSEGPLLPTGPDVWTRIYSGGTILAVDTGFATPEAIAIRGDRILATGSLEEVTTAAGDDAELIDLAGRTLMPGLIDPHTHILIGALMDQTMDYVGITRFRTSEEVLEHIRQLDADRPDGDWIVCRNYYPMLQPFEVAMGFEALDAISRTRPIMVLNASGHIGYANQAAFAAAGIPADVANPPGGEFVRDEQGELTGEMRNQITFTQVLSARPAGFGTAPAEAVIRTCQRFAALGLTTVSELGLGGLLRGQVTGRSSNRPAQRAAFRNVSAPIRCMYLKQPGKRRGLCRETAMPWSGLPATS